MLRRPTLPPRVPRIRRRYLTALIGLCLFACAGGAAFATIGVVTARDREIDAAEQRWKAQQLSHYVMTIDELNCIFEVEVRDGRAVRLTPAERCQRDARTVEELFAIARRDGDTGMRCITLGCACDDVLTVDSSFHPHLGYPTRIYVQIAAQPNWRHPDAWRYLAVHRQAPPCDMMVGDKLLRVVDLRPLP